jgi:hypothetical protein
MGVFGTTISASLAVEIDVDIELDETVLLLGIRSEE